MKRTISVCFISALVFIFFCPALLFAQTVAGTVSPPPSGQMTPPATQGQQGAPSSESAAVELKPMRFITFTEGLLSIELVDQDFGGVITEVARIAGFRIEGTAPSFQKKLTTRFEQIDLERGIARLLSLAAEKNFFMHYDQAGNLSVLEFFGGSPAVVSSPSPTPLPQQQIRTTPPPPPVAPRQPVVTSPVPRSGTPSRTIPSLRRIRQVRPAAPAEPDMADQNGQSPETEDEPPQAEPVVEEPVQEIPYVPPQRQPLSIPARPR